MDLFGRIKKFFGRRKPMTIETALNPSRKVVLVHGYSDRGASFVPWAKVLRERGFSTESIQVVTYKSLTNEVTIKDLAEGFERALKARGIAGDTPFDAIVHSTGMLVVRAWLTASRDDRARVKRLKHLIGFAPATWGSPLAHRGRGFLGSIFKGNKATDPINAPDFLEAGDLILDGLELASKFTWDLAHVDLFDPKNPYYGEDGATPYPFIFCGNEAYGGYRKFINEPGTDGTVRFAGVSLDSRKFSLDLTRKQGDATRLTTPPTSNIDAPVIFVNGKNHGTILGEPDRELANFVVRALNVSTHEEFKKWVRDAQEWGKKSEPDQKFQHFVIHLTDERGDPIEDYHVQLFKVQDDDVDDLPFDLELHPYQRDKSFRSYHVDVAALKKARGEKGQVWMRVTLSSGTILVAYHGISNEGFPPGPVPKQQPGEDDAAYQLRRESRPTEINLNLTDYLSDTTKTKLFWPFTTTLVEIKVDREPLPFGDVLARLCEWENLSAHGLK